MLCGFQPRMMPWHSCRSTCFIGLVQLGPYFLAPLGLDRGKGAPSRIGGSVAELGPEQPAAPPVGVVSLAAQRAAGLFRHLR